MKSKWASVIFVISAVFVVFACVLAEVASIIDAPLPQIDDIDSKLAAHVAHTGAVAAGIVIDQARRPVTSAHIVLESYLSKDKKLSERTITLDQDGIFVIQPDTDLLSQPNLYTLLVKAEASFHTAGSAETIVQTGSDGRPSIQQKFFRIRLKYLNPNLTLVLCLPLVFGLVLSVVNLALISGKTNFTAFYTISVSLLWTAVVGRLTFQYVKYGEDLIPLFWPDLSVYSGVVVFSFLGSMTYASYSIFDKSRIPRHMTSEEVRHRYLLTLGGRLLIAPYIALVAFAVFSTTFPSLNVAGFALFFSFFCGLYIKVVMDALNDLGMRFLSVESRAAIAKRFRSITAAETAAPISTSTAGIKPTMALQQAANAAREALVAKHEEVIGVMPGTKVTANTDTGKPALVVYVTKKSALTSNPVPTQFSGFSTDVRELPVPTSDQFCNVPMFGISWPKFHIVRGAESETTLTAADSLVDVDPSGRVLIVPDPQSRFFDRHGRLDPIGAYQAVQQRLLDVYEFIAFVVVPQFPTEKFNNWYAPLFNDIAGIGFWKDPSPDQRFDERNKWSNSPPQRLRGCQILYAPLTLRTLLHEIGHAWGVYLTFDGLTIPDDGMHWDRLVDDGRSCMDYDRREWVAAPVAGQFLGKDIADVDFDYSDFDLYLMGILQRSEIRAPLRVFKNPSSGDVVSESSNVSLDRIISVLGERLPASSGGQIQYRQAFVVISKDEMMARNFAEDLVSSGLLDRHEANFSRATRSRATLSTKLV